MPKRIILATLLMIFLCSQNSYANKLPENKIGFGINYSKLKLDNLPIGQEVSLVEIINLPLIIKSQYNVPILVTVFSEKPRKEKLEKGYEIIPNADWIVPEYKSLTITASGEVSIDIKLVIPDDPKLFSKKFQGDIVVTTGGNLDVPSMVQYGFSLRGKILFSIAPGRNEAALQEIKENKIDSSFEMKPQRVDVWDVKPGEKVTVKSVLVKNTSKRKQTYNLASVAPETTTVSMDKVAQATNVADQVILKKDVIKLLPRRSTLIPLTVNVPKDVDFSKGPLFYLVSVRTGKKQAMGKYIYIYLWDKKKP